MVVEKYITKSKETAVTVSLTKIDSIGKRDVTKTGLRVYKNDCIGIAGAVGNYNELELESYARKSLDDKIKYPCKPSENRVEKVDNASKNVNENIFINDVEEVISYLQTKQPDFIFSNKISLIEKEIQLVNDKNLDLYYKDKYVSTDLSFRHKNSIDIMDGTVSYEGRRFNKQELLSYINNICNAYNNEVDLPREKKYPVIFPNLAHYALCALTSKFAQELHAQSFAMQGSLLSGKIGQKVFNDNFTLY